MDVEIAVDLFHVSFGIMRQLRKDLPWQWGQHNHSYSPILPFVREGFPYSWLLVGYWIVS